MSIKGSTYQVDDWSQVFRLGSDAADGLLPGQFGTKAGLLYALITVTGKAVCGL